MNYLLAKTKGRTGSFYKVISDEEIYSLPADLENAVGYEPGHNLDEDSWFAINEFSEKNYFMEFLGERFIAADYNQIEESEYSSIDFLCAYQRGTYFFQKIFSKQFIKKKYFTLSDEPALCENIPIVVLNEVPDAVYMKNADILYFKDLSTISSIFRGIDILYREATQTETETFLENSFIRLENGYNADHVKKANRKRIALAMETLSGFTRRQKRQIFNYVKEYCEDLEYNEDDQNFGITCEEDLKKLLYGIEQRYYTTQLGDERRLANSIIRLS